MDVRHWINCMTTKSRGQRMVQRLISKSVPRYERVCEKMATQCILQIDGWIGFGISVDGSMDGNGAGSDIWVGYVDSGSCSTGCLNDYWVQNHVPPSLDTSLGGSSNLVLASAESVNGYTTFEFSRALKTGDSYDRDLTPDFQQYFLYSAKFNTKPSSRVLTSSDEHDFGGTIPGSMKLTLSSTACSHAIVYSSCQLLQDSSSTRYSWVISGNTLSSKLVTTITTGWIAVGFSSGTVLNNATSLVVGYFDNRGCSSGCLVPGSIISGDVTLMAANATDYNFTVITTDVTNGQTTFEWSRTIDMDTSSASVTANTPVYLFMLSNDTATNTPLSSVASANFGTTVRVEVVLAHNISACTVPPLKDSYTNPDGTWTVFWNIVSPEIHFLVKARTSGWVGLGISTTGEMSGSDIIWGQINSDGTPVVSDRWATGESQPGKDSEQNVIINADESSYTNGVTTLSYTRLLNTGDSKDTAIKTTNMYLLWAIGSSKGTLSGNDYDFDQHASRGAANINFYTGFSSAVSTSATDRKAHGIIMITAWGFTVLVATFVARYLKSTFSQWFLFGYSWLHIHAILQVLTMVLTLIAFIIICVWVTKQDSEHFKGAHEVIGLVIFICSVLQPILGVVTERLIRKDKNQHYVQRIIAEVHVWFGRAIILLAIMNIYFGFYLLCVHPLAIGAFSAALGIYLIWFGSHEVLRWLPWGAYLGGPGFTFDELSKGGNKEEQNDNDENNANFLKVDAWTQFTETRRKQEIPLPYKITLWSCDSVGLLILVVLWVLVVAGISISDVDDPDKFFDSSCTVGTFPSSS
eukprot:TRINITY_DN4998_c0_g1_i1.p1 TRINITY_DN4998_c0_g1~~TRINITY_DN4998_c0_g1_i1.p1  ORF type:complete len:806 (+),score=48.88 TRINITY_DN4998_c0_g1_i1:147-2564(+)